MGVAEPADGENNEEQAQRKSGRIRKPPARYGRSPQERKKKRVWLGKGQNGGLRRLSSCGREYDMALL